MKIEKRIHLLWIEYNKIPKKVIKEIEKKIKVHYKCPVAKYQVIYSTDKGRISLVHFLKRYPSFVDEPFWEIYCLEGNLLEDVERFKTKLQAEKRIKELL